MGSPGVGKTHLATSLGIEAARKRNSVYFISCNDLITNLSKAFKENRLESKIKFYCKYKLLIIDEIGYLPITKDEANMFFQLIAKRYENKPTIITTNQSFSKWGEVFGDTTIAAAIVDRLVHHSVIINIKGKSYRIKDLVQEDFEDKKSS
jgi:DNA replication protein DnaC